MAFEYFPGVERAINPPIRTILVCGYIMFILGIVSSVMYGNFKYLITFSTFGCFLFVIGLFWKLNTVSHPKSEISHV
jgi:hypothetical protein